MSSEPNHNRQKNHKALTKKQKEAIRRKKRQRKIILLVVEILVVLILAIALFLISKLGKIERQEVPLENIEVNEGISEESKEIMKSYTTIALFGLDNRSNGNLSKGRSDVIMIANINNDTKEVKLCSVFRDSYLDTGDGSFKKCNAAYAKGGPEAAINMLNKNLDLSITDYVTVDFNAVVECVDLLGGITLDEVTDEEAVLMQGYMDEINKLTKNNSKYLSGGGTFDEDHFQKNTKIKISKLGSTYTVECYVEYTDYTTVSVIRSQYESSGKNVYKPTTLYGDGIVYKQEFTNGLPPVYLLYVPAIYNGSYCTTDTITVDNSGISEKADVYVFETTAELSDTYKKIIREQFNVANVDDLTYTNAGKNTKMSDVKVRLKLAAGAKSSDLNVYANFDFDNVNSDYPVARLTEDQSDSVYMYDITVTLTDSKGNKTTVTGTRGK